MKADVRSHLSVIPLPKAGSLLLSCQLAGKATEAQLRHGHRLAQGHRADLHKAHLVPAIQDRRATFLPPPWDPAHSPRPTCLALIPFPKQGCPMCSRFSFLRVRFSIPPRRTLRSEAISIRTFSRISLSNSRTSFPTDVFIPSASLTGGDTGADGGAVPPFTHACLRTILGAANTGAEGGTKRGRLMMCAHIFSRLLMAKNNVILPNCPLPL